MADFSKIRGAFALMRLGLRMASLERRAGTMSEDEFEGAVDYAIRRSSSDRHLMELLHHLADRGDVDARNTLRLFDALEYESGADG
jgi:hypothetical protein